MFLLNLIVSNLLKYVKVQSLLSISELQH